MDVSSPSIVRDPDKCILCGKCVRVCEEVQGVAAIDFVGRGGKTMRRHGVRPRPQRLQLHQLRAVHPGLPHRRAQRAVLRRRGRRGAGRPDEDRRRAARPGGVGDAGRGVRPEARQGRRRQDGRRAAPLGFDRVFDTSFTADLTIMEEGSELVQRVKTGGVLPMITSCSPGWIKFVEQFYPEFMPNLSTCKSPQQMMGAIIKSFCAEREGLDPANIVSVSIMPCTAKKFECARDGDGPRRRAATWTTC